MPLPYPQDPFAPYDFAKEYQDLMILDEDLNFGDYAEFAFESESKDTGGSEGTSIASVDTVARPPRRRYPCVRRPKRHLIFRSVKTSCWYLNYLKPGAAGNLTYELSASDRFGEFHHWFRMPLVKVDQLTEILKMNGCITKPRSLCCRAEFSKKIRGPSHALSLYFGEGGAIQFLLVIVSYFLVDCL